MMYTEINGEYFETIKSKNAKSMIGNHMANFDYHTLSYYYQKPSAIKERIYADWCEWYNGADDVGFFEITSASHQCFTIGAIYGPTYHPIGYIRITKDHNRLYLV